MTRTQIISEIVSLVGPGRWDFLDDDKLVEALSHARVYSMRRDSDAVDGTTSGHVRMDAVEAVGMTKVARESASDDDEDCDCDPDDEDCDCDDEDDGDSYYKKDAISINGGQMSKRARRRLDRRQVKASKELGLTGRTRADALTAMGRAPTPVTAPVMRADALDDEATAQAASHRRTSLAWRIK